jgi:streptomycin 6-kinase
MSSVSIDPFHRHIATWSLAPDGEPFVTASSHILFVRSLHGPAVLKVFKPPREEAGSSLALRHYGGRGAVPLIAFDEEAVLTRRVHPGTVLSDLVRAGRDDEATDIVCEVVASLHAHGVAAGEWPTVAQWGADFDEHQRSARAHLLPRDLVEAARHEFFELCGSQSEPVLLHGDLHHDNILYDEQLGWLAIDPKGVLGERDYELGAALRNPVGSPDLYTDPGVMRRRVQRMAARLGLGGGRVLRWCFAQAVLSAVWWVQDGHDDADVALEVARVSRDLMAKQ